MLHRFHFDPVWGHWARPCSKPFQAEERSWALLLGLCTAPRRVTRSPTSPPRSHRFRKALREGLAGSYSSSWCVTLVLPEQPFLAEEMSYSLAVARAEEMLKLLIWFQHHSVVAPFRGAAQFTPAQSSPHLAPARGITPVKDVGRGKLGKVGAIIRPLIQNNISKCLTFTVKAFPIQLSFTQDFVKRERGNAESQAPF